LDKPVAPGIVLGPSSLVLK